MSCLGLPHILDLLGIIEVLGLFKCKMRIVCLLELECLGLELSRTISRSLRTCFEFGEQIYNLRQDKKHEVRAFLENLAFGLGREVRNLGKEVLTTLLN